MARTLLYIATSLDGHIARPDGSLDWLTSIPLPESGDYGYSGLLDRIGTIIMGRRTYEEVIGFGIDWPYCGKDTVIATTNSSLKISSPDTRLLEGNLDDFVTGLKATADKDIWLVGGGQLVTAFIDAGLLDRMILSLIPRIIGEGIPLFAGKPMETEWTLAGVTAFDTGVVNLTYDLKS